MTFNLQFLVFSVLKIVAVLAWVYFVLWALGRKPLWAKLLGALVAFGIVQLALTRSGDFQLMNDFDRGLLFQACSMTMVALGLNLIYGFNGQFSLGQWGFYGLGAYAAADITYRWVNQDASGVFVAGLGVLLGGAMILGVGRLIKRYKGMPILSQFTLYLIGAVLAGFLAVVIGNPIARAFAGGFGSADAPGILQSAPIQQAVFLLAVLIGGAFAAEVSFLFGLPVLTLGSDYFGIATLGFSIVVQTLMVNTDTLLPFPEMKGGRGMIGIPKWTTWAWAFIFLMFAIIIMRNLIYSSTGRAIMSVREDETAGKAMGIDIAHYKLLSFVIGSLFAGLAGGIYAHYIGFLSPGTFDFTHRLQPADHRRVRRAGQHDRHDCRLLRLALLPGRPLARPPGAVGHRGAYLALRALPDHAAVDDVAAATRLARQYRVGLPEATDLPAAQGQLGGNCYAPRRRLAASRRVAERAR